MGYTVEDGPEAETDFYRPIDNPLVQVEIEHQDRRVSVPVPAH